MGQETVDGVVDRIESKRVRAGFGPIASTRRIRPISNTSISPGSSIAT
jgi:hypothetical protein